MSGVENGARSQSGRPTSSPGRRTCSDASADAVEYRVEQGTAKLEHRSARVCGWRTLAIAQTPIPVVEDTIARQ